ncbi:hypothetical protein CANMA_004146 [Candida margitis]|uniref:uncharacterized protein n=1 Tax=Candida margitis TaxID=1775924 RepID=UPI002225FD6A|nr:uncharacterized protein CANMA_004146 [Candida margitis]KAI5959128.1 hypothetical protein CANMA_004146 [Candida margitis]
MDGSDSFYAAIDEGSQSIAYEEGVVLELSPLHEYQCIAKYHQRVNKQATHWLYSKPLLSRYLIVSTQAVDTSKAGVKSNALPEYVEAVINHRVAVESTVDEVYVHDLLHAKRLAKMFGLELAYEGGHPS